MYWVSQCVGLPPLCPSSDLKHWQIIKVNSIWVVENGNLKSVLCGRSLLFWNDTSRGTSLHLKKVNSAKLIPGSGKLDFSPLLLPSVMQLDCTALQEEQYTVVLAMTQKWTCSYCQCSYFRSLQFTYCWKVEVFMSENLFCVAKISSWIVDIQSTLRYSGAFYNTLKHSRVFLKTFQISRLL